MAGIPVALKIVRDLGPAWAIRRVQFALETRFGILERRLPISDWDFESSDWLSPEVPNDFALFKSSLREKSRFLEFAGDPIIDTDQVCALANRVLRGEWPYFSRQWLAMGFPPEWYANPLDGIRADQVRHWSRIDIHKIHDVKFVWEPSRFSPVFLLARAYRLTQDERYPEAFWNLVEDWAEKNPPNQGVNWASGQEVAIRALAWCFGLFAFWKSAPSTGDRVFRLLRVLYKHAERIDGFMEYAISQRNNHGISEAVGLFTIGLAFPQLKRAAEWRNKGRKLIAAQLEEQIYPDGSYIQHAFNYQRTMLDLVLWAFRLAELNDNPFPKQAYEQVGRAAGFMFQFCDPRSGKIPNYGGNDGALILPLTSCDYSDFCPIIQAAHFLAYRKLCFGPGPWDELAQWLFGQEFCKSSREILSFGPRKDAAIQSGYLKAEIQNGFAMLRACKYLDRPAQADQLHMDVWWRGENVACDPGTYLYNGVAPWQNAFAATTAHNTVTVAALDQMTKAGRFLWLDWAQAHSRQYVVDQTGTAMEAWHDGYQKLGAKHTRSVLAVPKADALVVIDDLTGKFSGKARLQWLFSDCPFVWNHDELRMVLSFEAGEFQCVVCAPENAMTTLVRGGKPIAGSRSFADEELATRGWRSLYYGVKEPAISLALASEQQFPQRFVSVLAPTTVSIVRMNSHSITLDFRQMKYEIGFSRCGVQPVFKKCRRFTTPDRLTPASVPPP